MCKNIIAVILTIYVCVIPESAQKENDDLTFTCPEATALPQIHIFGNSEGLGDGKVNTNEQLTLQCIAAYPVYWDFIPTQTAYYMTDGKVSMHSNGYCYKEELVLSDTESWYRESVGFGRSGNYTCRSGINATVSSSKFVYSKDNARIFACPGSIFKTHSRIINGTEWVIPCPANLKDEYLNVSLSKPDFVDINGSVSPKTLFPGEASIRYDSRYGFLLKKSIHPRPTGAYACEVLTLTTVFDGVSSHEKVDLQLIEHNVIPASGYVTYANGGEIIVTCEYDEEIYINTESAFMLKSKLSILQMQTSSFNYSLTHTFEETADPGSDGREGEISCRVRHSNKVLHTWKHDVRKRCNATTVNEKSTYRGYYSYSSIYGYGRNGDVSYITFSNPFSYRMKISSTTCNTKAKCDLDFRYFEQLNPQNHRVESSTTDKFKMHASGESMVIKCEMDINYSTMFLSVYTTNEINLNPNNVTSEEKISVVTNSGGVSDFFLGDNISITCQASKYFYNSGIKWYFTYKNGSESFIKGYDNSTELYMSSTALTAVTDVVTKDPEVSGVACSLNVWNSTSWESGNIKLNIQNREIWDENDSKNCAVGFQKPTIVFQRYGYFNHPMHYYRYYKSASHVVTDYDVVITYYWDFTISCIAKYPIKLTREGTELYYGNDAKGLGATYENDTLHHCFRISVYGYAYSSSSTGEYLCEKLNDPNVKSSFYFFVNLSPNTRLLDDGGHKVVNVDPKASTLYIPCRVTDPSTKLDLYYHETHGKYKKLNDSSYISYDPKKGFLMETRAVNLSSIYICSTQINDNGTRNTVSFTFWKNETQEITSTGTKEATTDNSIFGFLTTNFTFLFLLIISVVGLQLYFLQKQFKLDGAIRRIFGSYINLEPELTTRELQGNDSNINLNTELIPSVF